jgi:RNA polymerase sigma-70 factor (ECF subfamily)
MELNENDLFLAVKNDSYVAFNELFVRFYRRLCLFSFRYTEDEDASQDVVQELFIKLWTNRHQVIIHDTVSAYLFRSARNASLNYLRSQKNKQNVLKKMQLPEIQTESEDVEFENFLIQLQECVDQLPERSRQVFVMNRFQELKLADISEKLEVSVNTIKNQLWKSLQYLRTCLQALKKI